MLQLPWCYNSKVDEGFNETSSRSIKVSLRQLLLVNILMLHLVRVTRSCFKRVGSSSLTIQLFAEPKGTFGYSKTNRATHNVTLHNFILYEVMSHQPHKSYNNIASPIFHYEQKKCYKTHPLLLRNIPQPHFNKFNDTIIGLLLN